jgi:hypothetical protein
MLQHMKVVCVSVGLLIALSAVSSVSSAMRHRPAPPTTAVRVSPQAAQSSLVIGAAPRAGL